MAVSYPSKEYLTTNVLKTEPAGRLTHQHLYFAMCYGWSDPLKPMYNQILLENREWVVLAGQTVE